MRSPQPLDKLGGNNFLKVRQLIGGSGGSITGKRLTQLYCKAQISVSEYIRVDYKLKKVIFSTLLKYKVIFAEFAGTL